MIRAYIIIVMFIVMLIYHVSETQRIHIIDYKISGQQNEGSERFEEEDCGQIPSNI